MEFRYVSWVRVPIFLGGYRRVRGNLLKNTLKIPGKYL